MSTPPKKTIHTLLALLRERDEEIARLREALKPIEEVYKRADMYDNSLTCQYCTAWRAVKKAVEGMK